MKVLILAIHWPVASGRYMAEALRRMGHDVRTAGPVPDPPNSIWGGMVDPRYIWQPAPPEGEWEPELVIVADSHLGAERTGTVPWVVYGVDNHVRDYRQFDGVVDHFFLAHGHGSRMGEPNVTWLPCAYDPVLFTPGPAWERREYDAALIGVLYGPRAELLYALRQGIPELRMAYGTGAIYDQYASIYQNARLSVVRSANKDVAQRVWETAAMGCLVLMDDCDDCAALGLQDGENCLIYHDAAEAIDKARWALAHPAEAEQIALAGQAWAQPGTWDNRLSFIIDWVLQNTATHNEKEGDHEQARD